jgi:hypothetical protein
MHGGVGFDSRFRDAARCLAIAVVGFLADPLVPTPESRGREAATNRRSSPSLRVRDDHQISCIGSEPDLGMTMALASARQERCDVNQRAIRNRIVEPFGSIETLRSEGKCKARPGDETGVQKSPSTHSDFRRESF